jgi:hypothetical protein
MIKQLQNALPEIDFGLGATQTTTDTGIPVTVWLNTLYNLDAYVFILSTQGNVTKISDYEYQIVFYQTGTHEIKLDVISKTKKISLQSNTITVTVL